MYSHEKSIERVRVDKYPVNETMNAFYINKKVLENYEYMRTQKSFLKGRDKMKKVSMNNMMILNNSFNYDQAAQGASLNTKTSVDSIGFLKG
jgi:hypothetical protein